MPQHLWLKCLTVLDTKLEDCIVPQHLWLKLMTFCFVAFRKEELEQRKKEQSTVAEDSDILKMINATTISKSPSPTPASTNDGKFVVFFQLW